MKRACLAIALVSAILVATTGTAAAGGYYVHCDRVNANGKTSYDIEQHDVGCGKTQDLLRRWMNNGFPNSSSAKWFCGGRTSDGRKICTRGNGDAPHFLFRLKRR